jgi:hypothetical protein
MYAWRGCSFLQSSSSSVIHPFFFSFIILITKHCELQVYNKCHVEMPEVWTWELGETFQHPSNLHFNYVPRFYVPKLETSTVIEICRQCLISRKIWDSHGKKQEECWLLVCNAIEYGRKLLIFRKNVLPPFFNYKSILHRRWRQYFPTKHR